MSPSLMLFDLDGTLVDSAPDIARALNAAMAEVGASPLPVPEVVTYVGDGATKLVERAMPHPPPGGADVPGLVDSFRRHYAAGICVETRPYPGIVELLRRLADARVRMAVLTNKPGDLARALLRALALDPYFVEVIGDGDGWARKPAPDAARALLARHAVDAGATLMVGDGVPDLRLGRALPCRVAAVSWGYTARAVLAAEAPDWIVDDPAALLGLKLAP
jgi:phosphoglycolate phosphatase